MATEIDERISEILEYLIDEVELGEKEIRSIKTAIVLIHEITPTDLPLLFNKLDNIIKVSDDLSWTVSKLKRYRDRYKSRYKSLRDPLFTALTRKGRPSTVAIECEIRVTNEEVLTLENNIDSIDNIIEYLQHIELCLDRYIWAIKDRISISKM